jgi:hypothetical protein
MLAKFVFVTEIHQDKTKNGTPYTYIFDQDKTRWSFFKGEKVETNKGYIFHYEEENGFFNVKQIEPATNVFKVEAAKELASKNDIVRNLGIATSYAVDLVNGKSIELKDLETYALKLYKFIQSESESMYNATQTPKQEIK